MVVSVVSGSRIVYVNVKNVLFKNMPEKNVLEALLMASNFARLNQLGTYMKILDNDHFVTRNRVFYFSWKLPKTF